MAASYGVTAVGVLSDTTVLESAFTTIQNENIILNQKMETLEAMVVQLKAKNYEKKTLTEKKGFERLVSFTGEEKMFGDWEFKLHQFVRPEIGFEAFLDEVKDLDKEPDDVAVQDLLDNIQIDFMSTAEASLFDEQLYNLLSMLTDGAALTTVRNARELRGIRGAVSWHRITRDVAGKTGNRLERLLDRVHHPPKITSYANAEHQLNQWQSACIELEKIERQGISEPTKRTVLKNMLPVDLIRDIERDQNLKTFAKAWPFVLSRTVSST